jgi:hypothetical protein
MLRYSALALPLVLAACNGNLLPPAQVDNVVDTVTLSALHGGALPIPSAYSIPEGFAVRTDQSAGFDFVYDILPPSRHVLMPLAAIGLGSTASTNPGLQKRTETFADIISAPRTGYSTTDTLDIAPGDVIVARSRVSCYLGVPQYGKLQVLDFDDNARTVRLQVLANTNCGYRGLAPGVPKS